MAKYNIRQTLIKSVKNKNFTYIIIILLILYISKIQSSKYIVSLNILFNTPLAKFVILTIILLVSMHNPQIGVILTIAYLTTIFMYRYQVEGFVNNNRKKEQKQEKKEKKPIKKKEDFSTEYAEAINENQLLEKFDDTKKREKHNNKGKKERFTVKPRKLDPNNENDVKYITAKQKAEDIIKNIDNEYTDNFEDLNAIIEHRINDVINVLDLVDDDDE